MPIEFVGDDDKVACVAPKEVLPEAQPVEVAMPLPDCLDNDSEPSEIDFDDPETISVAAFRLDDSSGSLVNDKALLTSESEFSPNLDRLRVAGQVVHSLPAHTLRQLVARHCVAMMPRAPLCVGGVATTMEKMRDWMEGLNASLLEVHADSEGTELSITWGMDRRIVGRVAAGDGAISRPMGLSSVGEVVDGSVRGSFFTLASALPVTQAIPRGVTQEQWRSLRDLATRPYGLILLAAPQGERRRANHLLAVLRQSLPVQERPIIMDWHNSTHAQKVLTEATKRVIVAMVDAFDSTLWLLTPGQVDPVWRPLLDKVLLARVAVTAKGRVCHFCGEVHRTFGRVDIVAGDGCQECAGLGFIGAVTLLDVDLVENGKTLLRLPQAISSAMKEGWIGIAN